MSTQSCPRGGGDKTGQNGTGYLRQGGALRPTECSSVKGHGTNGQTPLPPHLGAGYFITPASGPYLLCVAPWSVSWPLAQTEYFFEFCTGTMAGTPETFQHGSSIKQQCHSLINSFVAVK